VLSDPDYDHGHGERIFINNIGAAWNLYPDDLDDAFFESNMVVFGGTALVPHIHQSLLELLKKAKGKKAVMRLAASACVALWQLVSWMMLIRRNFTKLPTD
jgi:sugar/nucleoside kinase (ribokinase family)